MKPLTVLALLACALVSSSAQDATKMEVVIELKKQTVVQPGQPGQTGKATELELKKRLEFEGFLTNLGKTNNAVKIFDLTQPLDEKKAKEQVTEQATTSRISRGTRGWKLLSIRF